MIHSIFQRIYSCRIFHEKSKFILIGTFTNKNNDEVRFFYL